MVPPQWHESGIDVSYELAGEAGDPGFCRRAATASLHDRVPDELLNDVLLVVSELVANGVLHAPGGLRFHLQADGPRLTVAVEDDVADDAALEWGDPGVHVPRGRGLLIVDQLADRWGVELRPTGKRVWAAFDLDRSARGVG